MPRQIHAFVHTDALRHNLARMRAAAPDARVWAVVKANAYGHGIERVLRVCAQPMALPCLTWMRRNGYAAWAGAARCGC